MSPYYGSNYSSNYGPVVTQGGYVAQSYQAGLGQVVAWGEPRY